jgi:hypothetical protein
MVEYFITKVKVGKLTAMLKIRWHEKRSQLRKVL